MVKSFHSKIVGQNKDVGNVHPLWKTCNEQINVIEGTRIGADIGGASLPNLAF
jgi:hypothetical protein